MDTIIFVEASQTGAGEVACRYARQCGYSVVLLTTDPGRYPQAIVQYCNHVVSVDTMDVYEMVEALAMLMSVEDIKAITTTSDFSVVEAAQLAQYYLLPTNTPDAVRLFKNKYAVRQAIDLVDSSLNPKYCLIESLADADEFIESTGFPFIAKPVNGNDSLYVKKVRNIEELEEYLVIRDRWGVDASGRDFAIGVLLEEIIGGEEFCVDFLKPVNGDLILVGAFRKIISNGLGTDYIKIGASFPAPRGETKLLFDKISPVLNQLNFEVGAVNIDCKIVGADVK
ncbi:ATP-grasp domain-containing protein, partial [Pseudomonas sp. MH10]